MTADEEIGMAWLRKQFATTSDELKEKMNVDIDPENAAQIDELKRLISRRQTIGTAIMLFDPSFDYACLPA